MKKNIFCLALMVLSVFAGCNSAKVELSGKVTYTDGTPLTVGEVCFETDTYMARGSLKADGTYTVGSFSEKDGLPKGTYRVYISGADKLVAESDGMQLPQSLIDEKYRQSTTSGLMVNVPTIDGKYNIKVEPNPHK
ncbi:MAG: hypothetical protein LBJ00_15665 [Planctomycetaceae bacterium]|nr:hypothetical protein [Planctomycetaceae bacterium]